MNPKPLAHKLVPLALLCLVIGGLFANFWGWDLWNPDEPRYAQVAREMFEGGHWIVPRFGGKIYPEKPPLYFWLLAGSYALFGINAFAVRILPVLSAVGTILVVWRLGRRLFNPRVGLFGAIVLATSVLFMRLARHGNIDSTLTLVTTSAMALFALAHFEGRRRLYLPAYLLMAMGVLTKGPVAFLLPTLSFVLFLVVTGEGRAIRRMRLLPGLVLVAVIVAAWTVPAALKGGPEYTRMILFEQNIARAVAYKSKPVFYYFQSFPANFLPWIFFLPQAIVFAVRRRTPKRILPVIWFATIFVFFTLVRGKRSLYLLPLFPAAALVVGVFGDACLSGEIARRALDVPALLLGAFLVAAAGVVVFLDRIATIPDYLEQPARVAWMVAVVLGTGGVALLGAVWARRRAVVVPAVSVTMVALGLVMALAIFPVLNSSKSARFICEDLLRHRQGNEPVLLYRDGTRTGAYRFYTGLSLIDSPNESELVEQLRSGERTYIIIRETFYDELEPQTTEGWKLVVARQVGHRLIKLFLSEGVRSDTGN